MTAMPEETPAPKKKTAKKAATSVEKMVASLEGPPPLKVVKPKPKPGTKEFDWAAEYPGEELYLFTSSEGLTIGLTRLGPHRKPKPGLLRRLHREGAARPDQRSGPAAANLVAERR